MSSSAHRILITGAAGLVGSRLLQDLIENQPQCHIVATDIQPTPPLAESDLPSHVVYKQCDIRSPDLAELIHQYQIETVVHLATVVTPPPGMDEQSMFDIDVGGTGKLLEACLQHGVDKIIVTSSGAAYGYHADNDQPLTEESPIRGNDIFPYARHKRLVEEMLAQYRQTHPELKQLIFRPGTILGPGFSNQITDLFEKPRMLGIKGYDSPFVIMHVDDVVACLIEGVISDKTGIYNLAGDGTLSSRQIAGLLGNPYLPLPAGLVKTALRVLKPLGLSQYGPEQTMFLQYRPVLSNDRLKTEFGYQPRYTTIEAFKVWAQSKGLVTE